MPGLACRPCSSGTVVGDGAPACLQLKETRVVNDNLVAQLERLKQEKAALVHQVTQLRQSCQERAAQNAGLCMQVGTRGSPPESPTAPGSLVVSAARDAPWALRLCTLPQHHVCSPQPSGGVPPSVGCCDRGFVMLLQAQSLRSATHAPASYSPTPVDPAALSLSSFPLSSASPFPAARWQAQHPLPSQEWDMSSKPLAESASCRPMRLADPVGMQLPNVRIVLKGSAGPLDFHPVDSPTGPSQQVDQHLAWDR